MTPDGSMVPRAREPCMVPWFREPSPHGSPLCKEGNHAEPRFADRRAGGVRWRTYPMCAWEPAPGTGPPHGCARSVLHIRGVKHDERKGERISLRAAHHRNA
jgi:hypothetical protein